MREVIEEVSRDGRVRRGAFHIINQFSRGKHSFCILTIPPFSLSSSPSLHSPLIQEVHKPLFDWFWSGGSALDSVDHHLLCHWK